MIQVTFTYEPDEDAQDPDDRTGVTEEEFDKVTEALGFQFGAENIDFKPLA